MSKGDILIAIDFLNDQEGQLEAAIDSADTIEYAEAMIVLLDSVRNKREYLKNKLTVYA